jgi:inorganic pyrophosphatase/exopolyphosphatase
MKEDKSDVGTIIHEGAIKHETEVVQAVSYFSQTEQHKFDLKKLIKRAQKSQEYQENLGPYDGLLRDRLSKAVFVGHINTDLDSVAGAIGAAALFGGTPAISEPEDRLNGEILFALKNSGIETPELFDSIENSAVCDVVLVDHTEEKQMVPSIVDSPTRATRIVGILDHHALAKTFYTSKPIFMDLRPWGSISTIVAILFIRHKKTLPKPLAVLLLHAILSDTLNLRSVTTTEADRGMVALLSSFGGISNTKKVDEADELNAGLSKTAAYQETEIDLLAKRQFQAKTDWIVALGAYEMVRGDQKDFSCGPWKFGISVLEVTDCNKVLDVAYEILLELRLLKKEKGLAVVHLQDNSPDTDNTADSAAESASSFLQLQRTKELDFAFLFVVNIVEQKSILLIPGGRELALAKAAFMEADDPGANEAVLMEAYPGIVAPGSTIKPGETSMHLPPGLVSRKAQFVPAFFQALEQDFFYEAKGPVSQESDSDSKYSEADTQQVLNAIEAGKQGKQKDRGSMAIFSDKSNPEGQSIIQKESEEDRELVAMEENLTSEMDGNLYDENGRVKRVYTS